MNNSFYTCPMHPEVRQPAPGLCPECGMNLLPAKEAGKKHSHAGPREEFNKHAVFEHGDRGRERRVFAKSEIIVVK